jgi:opacity protein-like surface antigen
VKRNVRRQVARQAAGIVLAAALVLGVRPGFAQEAPRDEFQDSRRFRRVAFAITAGFSTWSLSSLKSFHEDRENFYAPYGFDLQGADFGASAIYGTEFQVRLNEAWYARAAAEWFRNKSDARGRATIAYLGGRRPVSMSIDTQVSSHPLLFSAGIGRAFMVSSFRVGVTASGILAPVRLEETYTLRMDTESKMEQDANGFGLGMELAGSIEMYTDAHMNVLLELYGRAGSAGVNLEHPIFGSTNIPEERDIDFTGLGIRLGFRWI